MALGDQAGKAAVDELVSQLPELKDFIAAQLASVQETCKQIVTDLRSELETVVGQTLADITAERTETLNQFADVAHGLLDRINGMAVHVPERKP